MTDAIFHLSPSAAFMAGFNSSPAMTDQEINEFIEAADLVERASLGYYDLDTPPLPDDCERCGGSLSTGGDWSGAVLIDGQWLCQNCEAARDAAQAVYVLEVSGAELIGLGYGDASSAEAL